MGNANAKYILKTHHTTCLPPSHPSPHCRRRRAQGLTQRDVFCRGAPRILREPVRSVHARVFHVTAGLPCASEHSYLRRCSQRSSAVGESLMHTDPAEIVTDMVCHQLPQDRSLPPVVFHYIPWFGSAASYGNDPVNFFFKCQAKVSVLLSLCQMGNILTPR